MPRRSHSSRSRICGRGAILMRGRSHCFLRMLRVSRERMEMAAYVNDNRVLSA